MNRLRGLLQIVLIAWAGGLWTICAFVAPMLFSLLPERATAGSVAGELFTIVGRASVVFAVATALLWSRSTRHRKHRFDYSLMAISGVCPVVSELALRAPMDLARSNGDMRTFGLLHALSALLFGIACIGTLILAVRFTRPDTI